MITVRDHDCALGAVPPIDNHYSDNYAHGKATACYRYKWTPIKPYIPPKWLVTRV